MNDVLATSTCLTGELACKGTADASDAQQSDVSCGVAQGRSNRSHVSADMLPQCAVVTALRYLRRNQLKKTRHAEMHFTTRNAAVP